MTIVLDACAIIAFLRNESGANVVEEYLLEEKNNCVVHAINICEVFYDFMRVANEETAKQVIDDLHTIGVISKEDLDKDLLIEAGKFKVNHKISLADCFAIALTNKLNGILITSDKEMNSIANTGKCNIKFIR